MKFFQYCALVTSVSLLLHVGSSVSFANPKSQNENVAKVGNVVITQEDVARRAQAIMPMQMGFHGTASPERIAKIKKEALEELVQRAYKVQYAINEEVNIDAGAYEKEWQERLEKNKQTVGNFTPEQLSRARFYYYFDFLAKKAEEVAVDENVNISDEDVEDYYAANKEKYFRPKLYTASHIFVRVSPNANVEERKEKEERAKQLLERAKNGEDFYNLAYYESDDKSKYVGGSLGSFHAGQTVAEFDAAIKPMQVGDVVGPVRTIYGYHIIKLDDLEEEKQLEFNEVSGKIRVDLENKKKKDLKSQWMDALEEKYPVIYFSK